MGVSTRTIIYTLYTITCDNCKKSIVFDTSVDPFVFNRRQAVRHLGWSFSRDGSVMCPRCKRCSK